MEKYLISSALVFIFLPCFLLIPVPSWPNPYWNIPGSYCQSQYQYLGCCSGRQDRCSVQILGTLCYCDSHCNRTGNSDCCPDYFTHCEGLRESDDYRARSDYPRYYAQVSQQETLYSPLYGYSGHYPLYVDDHDNQNFYESEVADKKENNKSSRSFYEPHEESKAGNRAESEDMSADSKNQQWEYDDTTQQWVKRHTVGSESPNAENSNLYEADMSNRNDWAEFQKGEKELENMSNTGMHGHADEWNPKDMTDQKDHWEPDENGTHQNQDKQWEYDEEIEQWKIRSSNAEETSYHPNVQNYDFYEESENFIEHSGILESNYPTYHDEYKPSEENIQTVTQNIDNLDQHWEYDESMGQWKLRSSSEYEPTMQPADKKQNGIDKTTNSNDIHSIGVSGQSEYKLPIDNEERQTGQDQDWGQHWEYDAATGKWKTRDYKQHETKLQTKTENGRPET